MTTPAFYYGTGRRKTAVARVRLVPGSGEIVVNDRSLEAHFGNAIDEADVRLPFRVTGTEGTYNAQIKVEGGGVTGQAGAIRHGIARALLQLDPEGNRLPLRQAGLLTRDPRMKERKKYGLKRARKAPQSSAVCFSGREYSAGTRIGWRRKLAERWVDVIVIRTFDHSAVTELAAAGPRGPAGPARRRGGDDRSLNVGGDP